MRTWTITLTLLLVACIGLPAASGGAIYVTLSGGGDGSAWNNAYGSLNTALNSALSGDTIYVEATTGGQYFDVATRQVEGATFTIDIQGGWSNVLTSPTQDGRSLVSAATTAAYGVRLTSNWPGASAHGDQFTMTVNQLDISNVNDGIVVRAGANSQPSRAVLNISNSSVTAQNYGLYVSDPGNNGPTILVADNIQVAGGQAGAGSGDGIFVKGALNGTNVQISNSSITSAGGAGVYLYDLNRQANGYKAAALPSITDTIIYGSSGDGLHFETAQIPTSGTSDITLDRVKLLDNGGYGVNVVQAGNLSGYGADKLNLHGTNLVVTGNGAGGLNLDGTAGATGTNLNVTIESSTIADNGGVGVNVVSGTTSNSITVHNSILAANTDGLRLVDAGAATAITESYNDFYGNSGDDIYRDANGSVSTPLIDSTDGWVDPMFVGSGDDPYQLTASSLLLDAGDVGDYPSVDVLGVSRPQGAGPALGAYESAAVPEPATLALLALGGVSLVAARRRRDA